MAKINWKVVSLITSVASVSRSVKKVVFDERRLKLVEGVRFFLTADTCDENHEAAVVRLEIVDDQENSIPLEMNDCIDLSEATPKDLAFPAREIVEIGNNPDIISTTILNSLAEEAELEITVDDYDRPNEVIFTLSVNNHYCSMASIAFSELEKCLSLRMKREDQREEE